MKSPIDLRARLARQWENADLRETRLLDGCWPIELPVGAPPPSWVDGQWSRVADLLTAWREVACGEVIWKARTFRATGGPVKIPVRWVIRDEEEWISAADDPEVASEFHRLIRLLALADPLFHQVLVRQRSLWRERPEEEVANALRLAAALEPGCAEGRPLRALPFEGVDTKFYERNRTLLTRLLDLRFDGEAGAAGLEEFLGAWREDDAWLLVVDLGGGLLPVSQMRVRSSELGTADLWPERLLVVENERCLHLLPRPLLGTLAVLGAGNNLGWLTGEWVPRAQVAYWGDLDTWGLSLLAAARERVPEITAMLMTRTLFDQHEAEHAVREPVTVPRPSTLLSTEERNFFTYLAGLERGRIEQEFIDRKLVHHAIAEWIGGASS